MHCCCAPGTRQRDYSSRAPPGETVVCQSNMTPLLGESLLFIPGYACSPPVTPSDFDRLISEYRLTQTFSWGGTPYCNAKQWLIGCDRLRVRVRVTIGLYSSRARRWWPSTIFSNKATRATRATKLLSTLAPRNKPFDAK